MPALQCKYFDVPELQVSSAALSLFNFGQQQAAQRGLLLVDTKYEFGKDEDGKIRLIDEVGRIDEVLGPLPRISQCDEQSW